MSNQFPSSPTNENVSSISDASEQPQGRRNQARRSKKPRRDEEDESVFDDEEDYENKKRSKSKRPLPGIQNKVISKPKNLDQKYKKAQTNQNPLETFLYKPGVMLPSLTQYLNHMIEIRIANEYISSQNSALMLRQIWGGNGVYASHSDAVAMSVHQGYVKLNDLKLQAYQGVALQCKVVKGKKTLNGSYKEPILSRSLKQQCAHCLKPEKILWLYQLGTQEQLQKWANNMALPENKRLTKKTSLQIYGFEQQQPNPSDVFLIKNLPPLNEGWIIWDMCNEPSQKYNVINFMDRQTTQGYKTNVSYKLKSHVLFIENYSQRYLIVNFDQYFIDLRYIWKNHQEMKMFSSNSKCILQQKLQIPGFSLQNILKKQEQKIIYNYFKLPIRNNFKKEIFAKLRWDDFIWGPDYMRIKNTEFRVEGLRCFKLLPLKIYEKPK